jgi:riboflavin synthase
MKKILLHKAINMFTGIIEELGKIVEINRSGGENIEFTLEAKFAPELKPDQSVAHNGVCLTVTKVTGNKYSVVAVSETLLRTNLGKLKAGDFVNLERCLKIGDRLDGHIVQGHIDTVATVEDIIDQNGSTKFFFKYSETNNTTVEKGSVCINGVSLTVVDSGDNYFSVVIIHYTLEHTNFKYLKKGDTVNTEFDIVGKYITAQLKKAR